MQEQNITAFNFANQNIPLPTESRNTSDKTFVTWGLDNLYPNFLLRLYRDSPTHSAIVNQKANYIVGNGLKLNNKDVDVMVNPSDSLKEFVSKITLDYLMFGAYSVEVIFNVANQPIEFHHVPLHKLRYNTAKDLFFFNKDWRYYKFQNTFERYNPKNNQDANSKIFFYDGYFPTENNVYSTPEYEPIIRPITTDIAINEFNLNNIKNHFSLSTIITFYNGSNVPEDVKKQMIQEIKKTYAGENGGKIMVDFQNKDGKGAEVKPLSSGDWDKAYIEVQKNNTDAIIIGHQCQSGSLFGIKTAGQLGNTQELETSYKAFKDNYIAVKRGQLESALMQMFAEYKPLQGKLMFKDKETFKTEIDKNKLLYMTIDELRAIDDLAPLPNGAGSRLLSDVNTPIAKPTPTATAPEPAAPVAQAEEPAEDVKKKSNSKILTEADFEQIKHLGLSYDDFEVLEELIHNKQNFSTESDIADYVINHDIKGLTINELVQVLDKEGSIKTNVSEVRDVLQALHESGIANVEEDDNGRIKVTPLPKADVPDTDKVSVMYKYIKRPGIKGDDLLPTSRGFCVKLIENNRLYTREDIQSMGAIFGYDIYKYTGGWYFNPDSQVTTPYCRHTWQALKVKRKK